MIATMCGKFPFAAFLAGVMLFCFSGNADAQYYRHSAGLKIGNLFAADYRYCISRHSAVDATVGVVNPFYPEYQFLIASAAYHYSFGTGVARLSPYIGGGLSAGVQFGHWNKTMKTRISYFMSADLPVGVEYCLERKPIVFCFEWSPKLQFLNWLRFVPQSVAVGVRFVLPQMRR